MFYLRDLPKYEAIRARIERYPQVDPEAFEATLHMLRVATDVLDAFDRYYAGHGVSSGRFSVLMLLNREPDKGLTPSDLAEKAGVTRATMTGLLDGLEKDALVTRRSCRDDRRMCYIHLTDKARQLMEAMVPDYYTRVANLMQNLSVDEKKTLVAILGKVNQGISAVSGQ